MELNFCTVCYRETSGDLYCGTFCRESDTPDDLRHMTPVASLRSSPTATAGFSLARAQGFRFRAFSTSSDDEDDGPAGDFVLPGKRNLSHTRGDLPPLAGAEGVRPQVSRPARPTRGGQGAFFGRGAAAAAAAAASAASAGADVEDTEAEFLAALTRPLTLEHRKESPRPNVEQPSAKKTANYIIKREFPGVF